MTEGEVAPKGYWIVDMNIHDPELYADYTVFIEPFLASRNARFLVRFGRQEIREGSFLPLPIVVEFPSFAAAKDAYDCDEYRLGTRARFGSAIANLAIVEGV